MLLKPSNLHLKTHSSLIDLCQRILDPAIGVALLASLIWKHTGAISQGQMVFMLLMFLLIMLVFNSFNLYRSWRGLSLGSEVKNVGLAWCLVQAVLLFVNSIIQLPVINSRAIYAPWVLGTFAGLAVLRLIVRLALQWFRYQGTNTRKFVILGAGELGQQLRSRIESSPHFGLVFDGFLDDDTSLKANESLRILGALDQIANVVMERKIDIVYIALPMRAEKRMREIVSLLQDLPVSVFLVPDIFVFELMNTRIDDIGGIPVFALYGTPFVGTFAILKRLQDIVLATIILVMISPLMLVIAIAIKLTSRGPIFFKQRRYGLFGEEIKVLKFRSMTVCEDGDTVLQAQKNDSRVTVAGRFLRRSSLDELPQFINVLRGDMSIVGPRPHAVVHNEYYRKVIKGYMLRHRVKPGITGWAQINGWRGETETLDKMERRVEYDLDYIRNWSLWLDIKIITMTVFKGFTNSNAF